MSWNHAQIFAATLGSLFFGFWQRSLAAGLTYYCVAMFLAFLHYERVEKDG